MDVVLVTMIPSNAFQITQEILNLVAGVDEFKGAWRTLGTLAPYRLSALRRQGRLARVAIGRNSCPVFGQRQRSRQKIRAGCAVHDPGLMESIQIGALAAKTVAQHALNARPASGLATDALPQFLVFQSQQAFEFLVLLQR